MTSYDLLVSRKSQLVIVGLNSNVERAKSTIRSSWSRFEYCSKTLVEPLVRKSFLVIILVLIHIQI